MDFIEKLTQQLKKPLPGRQAQLKMAHFDRKTVLKDIEIPKKVKVASTLTLLVPRDGEWYIALMQRVVMKGDKHSGQISFPGGRVEESDPTLEYAALRETEEEIGVPMTSIQPLGRMTQMFIPVSNFVVHPFIGYVKDIPNYIPDGKEVQQVIEMPLNDFLAKDAIKYTELKMPNGHVFKNVPYFDAQGHVVWGATAMMLSEFREILQSMN